MDVRLKVHAQDWHAALRCAGDLLVEGGFVYPEYVDEMERAVDKYGPYIVLAPGVAVPHAGPSHLVRKTGIAVVTLLEPVRFGSEANDPVDVLLPMAATDQDSHIKTVSLLARLLMSPEKIEAIRKAICVDDVRALLSNGGIAGGGHSNHGGLCLRHGERSPSEK